MLITFLLSTIAKNPSLFIEKMFDINKNRFLLLKSYDSVKRCDQNAIHIQQRKNNNQQFIIYINVENLKSLKEMCSLQAIERFEIKKRYIDTKTKKYISEDEEALKNVRMSLTNIRTEEYRNLIYSLKTTNTFLQVGKGDGETISLFDILNKLKDVPHCQKVESFYMWIGGSRETKYAVGNFTLEVINFDKSILHETKVKCPNNLWLKVSKEKDTYYYLIPNIDTEHAKKNSATHTISTKLS